MLIHICCSVDSHYFLQKLRQTLPNEPLIGYFYDPNIHPYSEYILRYNDVKRSCDKLGIDLIMGEYDYESWLSGTKGLENEPEKGKRCEYCFDFRVGNTALKAKELGEKIITTTLLMSPKKDFTQLTNALKKAVCGTDIEIYAVDFRSGGGTNEQFELAKRDKLYHQNYCGCIFGLSKQRQAQKLPLSELMSDAYARVLPGSIKERINLYDKVLQCEKNGQKFDLKRSYFLNYRLFFAVVKRDKKAICSYILSYSNFKRSGIKISIDENYHQNVNLRDGVIFIDISFYNKLTGCKFANVAELNRANFDLKTELNVRESLSGAMSQNPIIVLDEIVSGRYEIYAKNELYSDSREILITH
ncbi:epoxyqueuosine reductase QueH [Campylobacter majalis]|uniref:epoxyqueuosine reductase QueH n=1 Tax=Campylobacter majalis TaxID=2790656 RepID=UPI003D699518